MLFVYFVFRLPLLRYRLCRRRQDSLNQASMTDDKIARNTWPDITLSAGDWTWNMIDSFDETTVTVKDLSSPSVTLVFHSWSGNGSTLLQNADLNLWHIHADPSTAISCCNHHLFAYRLYWCRSRSTVSMTIINGLGI